MYAPVPARTVRAIFVSEAIVIGLIGMAAGWVLGYFLSVGMGRIEIRSPFMDTTHLPIYYAASHYLLAGAVALAASLIAGYFPARKAASVRPVEIVRGAS